MKQALYYSIVSASLAGLLFGGVMKLGPNALAEHGGPRILVSGENSRSLAGDEYAGGVMFTSHNGEIPDYVLGSDWTQPPEFLLVADDYGYEPSLYAPPPEPEPQVEDAVFVAPVKISAPPPPKPVSYPSIDGDILGGAGEQEPDALTQVVEAQQDPDDLPS